MDLLYALALYFFFNDTPPTEIYTLSLHDALPIYGPALAAGSPLAHQEHGILSTLQRRLNPVEFILAVYGLLINFKNNVAAGQAYIIGERSGLYEIGRAHV